MNQNPPGHFDPDDLELAIVPPKNILPANLELGKVPPRKTEPADSVLEKSEPENLDLNNCEPKIQTQNSNPNELQLDLPAALPKIEMENERRDSNL